jgi:type III pantothenate kinase
MLLALDLGNTSLSAGVFTAGRFVNRFKVPVGMFPMLADRLQRELGEKDCRRISTAALASVNPSLACEVEATVPEVLPVAHFILLGRDLPIPVEARVDSPAEVGADRLLATLGAFRRVKDACIVVDLGTAITVDAVSAKGEFLGGVIAPGLRMSAAALHKGTALLPEVTPEPIDRVIGKNTVACIRSGLYWGAVAMIEGLVARVKKEHPAAKKVIATGGDAELIATQCAAFDEVVLDLVLEGIAWTLEGVPAK